MIAHKFKTVYFLHTHIEIFFKKHGRKIKTAMHTNTYSVCFGNLLVWTRTPSPKRSSMQTSKGYVKTRPLQNFKAAYQSNLNITIEKGR